VTPAIVASFRIPMRIVLLLVTDGIPSQEPPVPPA
jgi:hypothetical protein